VRRDFIIGLVAIIVVGAVCYGLAAVRPPFQPTPSQPYTGATPLGKTTTGRIIMRINGEPVTQEEFEAAFHLLPEEMQRQFANEPGKMAFAEQLVRMKLLEQEAHRAGLDQDPKIAGQLAAQRTDFLADVAADKIIGQPTPQAVEQFYAKNKDRFQTLDLSHILIAYAGGAVPPRAGSALPETDAMNKALAVWTELKKGEPFAEAALKYSDDTGSARHGGELGPVAHGMLPQELEARVFQVPVGQFSSPIPSRLGIHIFRVNSKGTRPLAEIRAGVTQRVRQQNMFDRVEVLRKNAKVDFDEKFFPQAKQPVSGRKPS
jgi:peptidyl-prolyl cis-trans isomerase SurA